MIPPTTEQVSTELKDQIDVLCSINFCALYDRELRQPFTHRKKTSLQKMNFEKIF